MLFSQVEGEAQSEQDALDTFFDAVGQGPSNAKVTKVDKQDRDVVEGETEFEIRK